MSSPSLTIGRLHERELYALARVSYPFLANPTPDIVTKLYERLYAVQPARYSPKIAHRTSGAPDLDPVDSSAYLVEESPLQNEREGYAEVQRTFAKIPVDQVLPGSELFDRPSMHDIKVTHSSTDYFAVSFDAGHTSHLFNARKDVTDVGPITQPATTVAVAAESFGTLPATTFSINDGTSTVAPYLNAGAFAIQSAIEGALGALTGVSVSSTPDALTISWTGTVAYISTTATGVTMMGGAGTDGSVTFVAAKPTVSDTQTPGQPSAVRVLTAAAHGGAAGGLVACWNEDRLVGLTKAILADTNTVTIPADESPFSVGNVAITHLAFASAALARYVNGVKSVSTRRTQKFYLPGVSGGITTAADIPLQSPETDAVSWLTAILTKPTGWAVSNQVAVTPWKGPILMQEIPELQMADALDTVDVTA